MFIMSISINSVFSVVASILLTLECVSQFIPYFSILEVDAPDFLGIGSDLSNLVSIVSTFEVEGFSSQNPKWFTLKPAPERANTRVDQSMALIVSEQNIIWTPNGLPCGEFNQKACLRIAFVCFYSCSNSCVSVLSELCWPRCGVQLFRVLDLDIAIILQIVLSSGAITFFVRDAFGPVVFIPGAEVLGRIKVLNNLSCWASAPRCVRWWDLQEACNYESLWKHMF